MQYAGCLAGIAEHRSSCRWSSSSSSQQELLSTFKVAGKKKLVKGMRAGELEELGELEHKEETVEQRSPITHQNKRNASGRQRAIIARHLVYSVYGPIVSTERQRDRQRSQENR
jgi:hypothetical protein